MTDPIHWIQLLLPFVLLFAFTRPVGHLLVAVADPDGRTPFTRFLAPIENLLYRAAGIDRHHEQGWKTYAACLFATAALGLLASAALLVFQDRIPFQPDAPAGLAFPRALAVAAALVANASPDTFSAALSQVSHFVAAGSLGALAAATGLAVGAAMLRVVSRPGIPTVGSFWVDLIRGTLHVILPLSLLLALGLAVAGAGQQPPPIAGAATPAVEGEPHAVRPVAVAEIAPPVGAVVAQSALGALGGGSAPGRPDSIPARLALLLAAALLPLGFVYALGLALGDRAHGGTLWSVLVAILLLLAVGAWWAEQAWTARPAALGLDPASGNMEGKATCAGTVASSLSATLCAACSHGAPGCDPRGFSAMGGAFLVAAMGTWGGLIGPGGPSFALLLGPLLLAAAAAALLAGTARAYAGRRFGGRELVLGAALAFAPALLSLALVVWPPLLSGARAPDPANLRAALFEACSIATANGRALGPTPHSPGATLACAGAFLLARFLPLALVLALVGGLARAPALPAGTLRPRLVGWGFGALLSLMILAFGLIPLLPAIACGPILDHVQAVILP